jgi:hypothetical protein
MSERPTESSKASWFPLPTSCKRGGTHLLRHPRLEIRSAPSAPTRQSENLGFYSHLAVEMW